MKKIKKALDLIENEFSKIIAKITEDLGVVVYYYGKLEFHHGVEFIQKIEFTRSDEEFLFYLTANIKDMKFKADINNIFHHNSFEFETVKRIVKDFN